jgi:hypothetical protein
MDEYLKAQIRADAARLEEIVSMSAEAYVTQQGEGADTRYAHAQQLGGTQSRAASLLFWLKQAGLYVTAAESDKAG